MLIKSVNKAVFYTFCIRVYVFFILELFINIYYFRFFAIISNQTAMFGHIDGYFRISLKRDRLIEKSLKNSKLIEKNDRFTISLSLRGRLGNFRVTEKRIVFFQLAYCCIGC